MHASEKGYSYYSTVHRVYTRIDLLLVDQSSLELLADSTIDQITISDHAPVTITLNLPHMASRSWAWRLNENLLDDPRVVSGIEETLSHYFMENDTGEVSYGILWEGNKAVVCTKLKKE